MGETFWQFRRYRAEDPAQAVDWRQSAKSQHLFVREREWEAAEAVWFWRDGSPGMRFSSSKESPDKIDRASVLALALMSLLVRGGERIARFALRRRAARHRADGPRSRASRRRLTDDRHYTLPPAPAA